MKKVLLFLPFLLFSSCSGSKLITDEYLIDIGSINTRLRGELYRYVMNGNLESLDYNTYLNYLGKNERFSGEGVANKINSADIYNFKSGKETFVITLYYASDQTILSDNALTEKLDTIIYIDELPNDSLMNAITEKIFIR